MEDVLEVYQRSYDQDEVLVCLDETSKQQSLPSATTGGQGDAAAAAGPDLGRRTVTITNTSATG